MQSEYKTALAFVGLFAICGIVSFGLHLSSRTGVRQFGMVSTDLSNAATVEVHDQVGQRVLHGDLRAQPSSLDQVVRSGALLSLTGDAVGSAEIELTRYPNGTLVQELEIDVAGLPSNTAFEVLIDGRPMGELSTDSRGAAEFERFGRVAESRRVAD